METRASYMIVGGFVLVLIVGILVVALWVGGTRTDQATDTYRISFSGAVTGLRLGSSVLYRGVPVGSVTEITIDDEDNAIVVTIEVDASTPIKVDTEAVLELQILTGVANVQLVGGKPESPRLTPAPGETVAVIRAGQSALEELSESAPELIADLGNLVKRAELMFSDQNLRSISGILADVETLTSGFAGRSDDFGTMIDETKATLTSLSAAMSELTLFVQKMRQIAEEEGDRLRPTVDQVQNTAAAFARLAKNLDEVVSKNKRAFQDFASTGLYELSRFLTEARTLVAALQRLTERVERDPARFLFGDSQRGVKVD